MDAQCFSCSISEFQPLQLSFLEAPTAKPSVSSKVNEASCGLRKVKGPPKGRILGGNSAVRTDWPWIALLVKASKPDKPWCGATLLNSRYLMTAAHCIKLYSDPQPKDWKVRIGETHLDREECKAFCIDIILYSKYFVDKRF